MRAWEFVKRLVDPPSVYDVVSRGDDERAREASMGGEAMLGNLDRYNRQPQAASRRGPANEAQLIYALLCAICEVHQYE